MSIKASDEKYTPSWVIDLIIACLGEIDLDPTANINKTVKANRHITLEENCFLQQWKAKTVFMNPPFSNQNAFMIEFIEQFRLGNFKQGITLTLSGILHNKGCQDLIRDNASAICLWKGRLNFVYPDGNVKKGNDRDICLIYFGDNVNDFVLTFQDYGLIVLLCN